jgi:hypothetical protein
LQPATSFKHVWLVAKDIAPFMAPIENGQDIDIMEIIYASTMEYRNKTE